MLFMFDDLNSELRSLLILLAKNLASSSREIIRIESLR
jgi:hypothetical protein